MIIQILKKNPELRSDKDLTVLEPLIKEVKFFKERQIEKHHLNEICAELTFEFMPANEFVFR